ncbi:hypothetical protein DR864_23180 [Runella rosea]|uniref:Uncharacterized protein n=1 Tax=Runella rosea TaxID=2259595 RepID=A0A344TP64_9BACT|nr:hypothetical protein DR864_23180 [Runella rosea]
MQNLFAAKVLPKTQLSLHKIRKLVRFPVNTFQSNNYENQTINLLVMKNTNGGRNVLNAIILFYNIGY